MITMVPSHLGIYKHGEMYDKYQWESLISEPYVLNIAFSAVCCDV